MLASKKTANKILRLFCLLFISYSLFKLSESLIYLIISDSKHRENQEQRQNISILGESHRVSNNYHELEIREQISGFQLKSLADKEWKGLTKINLWDSKIRGTGCKYISNACLKNLNELRLGRNQIGSEGMLHLSKAQWLILQTVYLRENKIGAQGIKWLTLANWKSLNMIYLGLNMLNATQIMHLLKSCLDDINQILLSNPSANKQKTVSNLLKRKEYSLHSKKNLVSLIYLFDLYITPDSKIIKPEKYSIQSIFLSFFFPKIQNREILLLHPRIKPKFIINFPINHHKELLFYKKAVYS